jgi:hypothetical protein
MASSFVSEGLTFHCVISIIEDIDIPQWNVTAEEGPMEYADNIRISDSEREQVVDELGRHLTAGRLTIDEFDQRVAQVYRSVTQAQVNQVLRDLPAAPTPAPREIRSAQPARRRVPSHQRIEWLAWLAAGSLNIVIWGIISLATGVMIYFWPVWVIGPWGLVLLSRTLLGREGTYSKITGTVRCNNRLSAAAHN